MSLRVPLRQSALFRLPTSPPSSLLRLAPATACRRYQTDAGTRTTDIPDYSHYMRTTPHDSARTFQYFVVGAFGALTAVAGKATVTDFLATMSASADVLAMAKVEVDLSKIPEAKNLIIKYVN
jgi:ubiquinol-cytochrome c reductase iron-sulfur subunit